MELFITIFLFIVGLILIIKGGDWFVDASTWIAEISGIPKFIIGATVVSFATTLPELLVSVMASLEGSVDMAIGNAIGSVTANIGLIMAISIIALPIAINRKSYAIKSGIMLLASVLIVVFGLSGKLGTWPLIILFVIFLIAMAENIHSALRSRKEIEVVEKEKISTDKKEIIINIVKFIAGAAAIVIGANLLVDKGSILARLIGINERIIGVTIIAVGTSLPELVTTITAIVKKQSSLSIGNIIGANVIDLTLILPVCAALKGSSLPVAMETAKFDFPACLIVGCIALIPVMITGKFRRWQGFTMLAVYAGYVVLTSVAV